MDRPRLDNRYFYRFRNSSTDHGAGSLRLPNPSRIRYSPIYQTGGGYGGYRGGVMEPRAWARGPMCGPGLSGGRYPTWGPGARW